jgi:phospholipase C
MKKQWMGAAVAALSLLCACSGTGAGAGSVRALPASDAYAETPSSNVPLKHIVIIIQENRSFDNIFSGYPAAVSASSGPMSNGTIVPFHQVQFANETDMFHNWKAANQGLDHGKMDGFDKNLTGTGSSKPVGAYPYAYLERSQVAPYWAMAGQYVLADHLFPAMLGGSFTAHLDLIAATTDLQPDLSELDFPTGQPWGCDAPGGTVTSLLTAKRHALYNKGPFPCFKQFSTLADTLDAAHVSWKYYAPAIKGGDPGAIWSEFSAVRHVRYGPDWANVVSPSSTVLTDAANGTLPGVSWVIPDWVDSDHPGSNSDTGPSWVSAVVNAVGQGKDWNDTAIVVVWDDWGGWYDNVPPPQLDWKGLGIRVPGIVISPYAKKGYVSHTQYEFGSIIKLVEESFGLGVIGPSSFGYTDTRANSMLDSFDFTQKPRAFTAIPAKYPASHFMNKKPSMLAPDDD